MSARTHPVREMKRGLPFHMQLLTSSLIAKRQERRGRIWHLTSLHFSPSTSNGSLSPAPCSAHRIFESCSSVSLASQANPSLAQALLPVGRDISLWCLLLVSPESPSSPGTAQCVQVPCKAPQCCSGGRCHEVLHQITPVMLNIYAPCSFTSPYFPRHVFELPQILDFYPAKTVGT